MAVLFPSLKIEWLDKQFAALHGIQVDPVQQRPIVFPNIRSGQKPGASVRGFQLHRRYPAGAVTGETGLSVYPILQAQLWYDIVAKVREIAGTLRRGHK